MSDLTKLTVHLTAAAAESMDSAAGQAGDTRTDTVNRALQVYRQIIDAHSSGQTQQLDVLSSDGSLLRLVVLGDGEIPAPAGSDESSYANALVDAVAEQGALKRAALARVDTLSGMGRAIAAELDALRKELES